MQESWQNIKHLFVSPSVTFARLKTQPKWGMALILFCLLQVGVTWAVAPFTDRLIALEMAREHMPRYLIEDIVPIIGGFVLVFSLIAPLIAMVVFSATLTLAARIFRVDAAIRFRHIYASLAHASLIPTLVYFVNTAFVPVLKGIENVWTPLDMQVVPGLHLLSTSENLQLLMFLSHFNPLSIWPVAVLTIAVSILADTGKVKACFVAILIWLSGVALEVLAFK